MPKASLLERFGRADLRRRHGRRDGQVAAGGDGAVHLLDADERAALKRLERATLVRAGLIGTGSAGIAAVVEVALAGFQDDAVVYWGVLGAVSAACAIGEIILLSIDALRAAHSQAMITGAVRHDDDAREDTFAVLARAALEIPNPHDNSFALDPLRETPRGWLLFAAVVYKLKVSVTNIILKQLVRRAMGRAALRTALVPFVAVPVTAAWNVIVCARVLRELRVRVLGPAAAADIVDRVLPPGRDVSPALAESLVRAVGACVVRSADIHPNLVSLLTVLQQRLGLAALPDMVDSSPRFVAAFMALPSDEQQIVVPILRSAAILDGRARGKELALLREVGADANINDVLSAFVSGLPIPVGVARARTIHVGTAYGVGGSP